MAKDNPVILALGHEYSYVSSEVPNVLSINSKIIRPTIKDIVTATKSPFSLLLLDPDGIYIGSTEDKKYIDLWKSASELFGYYALKELIDDGVAPTDKLQIVSMISEEHLATINEHVGLKIPKESISYITAEDQESIIRGIIQSRLGMLTK